MTNVLIRGLTSAAVERIDAAASELGLSRNEFLRRKLEGDSAPNEEVSVAPADWVRSAGVFGDLGEAEVTDAAWR